MTVKTASMKITTSTEPTYTELLRRVRALFARDVDNRFEMAVIFSKMLKHKSAEEVSDDTDVAPGGIKRMAAVADFWGNVRIKPDGAGKRHAPWQVYETVATDPVINDERRVAIKRAAPRGLSTVRQMIRDARQVTADHVSQVVNGDEPTASRVVKPASSPRRLTAGDVANDASDDAGDDGGKFVDRSLAALREANANLDRLESLSNEDAARVNASVNRIVRNVIRLTQGANAQVNRGVKPATSERVHDA